MRIAKDLMDTTVKLKDAINKIPVRDVTTRAINVVSLLQHRNKIATFHRDLVSPIHDPTSTIRDLVQAICDDLFAGFVYPG